MWYGHLPPDAVNKSYCPKNLCEIVTKTKQKNGRLANFVFKILVVLNANTVKKKGNSQALMAIYSVLQRPLYEIQPKMITACQSSLSIIKDFYSWHMKL